MPQLVQDVFTFAGAAPRLPPGPKVAPADDPPPPEEPQPGPPRTWTRSCSAIVPGPFSAEEPMSISRIVGRHTPLFWAKSGAWVPSAGCVFGSGSDGGHGHQFGRSLLLTLDPGCSEVGGERLRVWRERGLSFSPFPLGGEGLGVRGPLLEKTSHRGGVDLGPSGRPGQRSVPPGSTRRPEARSGQAGTRAPATNGGQPVAILWMVSGAMDPSSGRSPSRTAPGIPASSPGLLAAKWNASDNCCGRTCQVPEEPGVRPRNLASSCGEIER